MEQLEQSQWFIITAIGGKEDSIKEAVEEKIRNFGYESYVQTIRIFKDPQVKEEIFDKNSEQLPKTMKNTKTTQWVSLPEGKYKRIKTRIVNRFPGYIFINMVMDRDVWYAIRNTPGVLGFVGSSGKGAIPIPITIDEFNNVARVDDGPKPSDQTDVAQDSGIPVEEKKTFVTNAKIGMTVEIISGNFNGFTGEIKSLDNNKGIAKVDVDMFGRVTSIEVTYDDFKLAV